MESSRHAEAMEGATASAETVSAVRRAVRGVLESAPAFRELPPEDRRRLARRMVTLGVRAAQLIREEVDGEREAARARGSTPSNADAPSRRPVAVAQSAGRALGGQAVGSIAGTTQRVLDAVSFPRFVTELVNGVFKAMSDSNMQQMQQYVELLDNVAASTESFADANFGPDAARQWLVDRFPGSFERGGSGDGGDVFDDDWGGSGRRDGFGGGGFSDEGFGGDEDPGRQVRLREGASMPSDAALRTALGIPEGEPVPQGDPEQTLVPLVRSHLARQRQQMLATMVRMGMQRIVIDSGRINASMRFHIDARSAAQDDRGSTFDLTNDVQAGASFAIGPWGASAKMRNTISYVTTEQTSTTPDRAARIDAQREREAARRQSVGERLAPNRADDVAADDDVLRAATERRNASEGAPGGADGSDTGGADDSDAGGTDGSDAGGRATEEGGASDGNAS